MGDKSVAHRTDIFFLPVFRVHPGECVPRRNQRSIFRHFIYPQRGSGSRGGSAPGAPLQRYLLVLSVRGLPAVLLSGNHDERPSLRAAAASGCTASPGPGHTKRDRTGPYSESISELRHEYDTCRGSAVHSPHHFLPPDGADIPSDRNYRIYFGSHTGSPDFAETAGRRGELSSGMIVRRELIEALLTLLHESGTHQYSLPALITSAILSELPVYVPFPDPVSSPPVHPPVRQENHPSGSGLPKVSLYNSSILPFRRMQNL